MDKGMSGWEGHSRHWWRCLHSRVCINLIWLPPAAVGLRSRQSAFSIQQLKGCGCCSAAYSHVSRQSSEAYRNLGRHVGAAV
jgi:hypothetical protein